MSETTGDLTRRPAERVKKNGFFASIVNGIRHFAKELNAGQDTAQIPKELSSQERLRLRNPSLFAQKKKIASEQAVIREIQMELARIIKANYMREKSGNSK